jgi:DNA-binding transcriptional LysR family regulator
MGRRLKLKDLQTLMTVVEAGGIGKAASRLNYSQPAVSKAIASLERTLGKRLLERGRKGIELTPYGDALLKCGVVVFDDLRKGMADIEFLSDPTAGEVRIGCTEPVAAGFISAIINRIARRYPRIVHHVDLSNPTTIYGDLDARRIDFAITTMIGHIDESRYEAEHLYNEPLVIVAGADHPIARRRGLELADLVDEPWTLPLPRSLVFTRLSEAFRANGLSPPCTTMVAPSAFLRIMLVASGHFLTAVPAVMLQVGVKQLSIKRLPIKLPGNRRPVGIVTLKDRALSPVAQLFIEQARAVAKAMARD